MIMPRLRLLRRARWALPRSGATRCAAGLPGVLLCLQLALVTGCGGPTGPPTPDDPSRLRGITTIYSLAARELGRPPQNVDELKAILAPATDDPSIALTSTRDQQEFAIVWGLDLTGRDSNSEAIVAYERSGVEGKRMVVNCRGEVREVTPEEFRELKFPKSHTPEGS